MTERCHAPRWIATPLLWQPKQGLDQGEFRGYHSDRSADLNDIAALPRVAAALGSKGSRGEHRNQGQIPHNC